MCAVEVDGPVVTRRQELGAASARSLLLTVLGEFVLPDGRPVWTAALIDLLGALDVAEKAARQAIMRTSDSGWIEASRVGTGDPLDPHAGRYAVAARGHRPHLRLRRRRTALGRAVAAHDDRRPGEQPGAAAAAAHPARLDRAGVGQRHDVGDAAGGP